MGQPGSHIIVAGERKDLGLVLHATEGRGKNDAVKVTLKIGAQAAISLLIGAESFTTEQFGPQHAHGLEEGR